MDEKDEKIKRLEEENKQLKIVIRDLNDKLYDKIRQVNKQWEDNYNEVRFERDI